MSEFKVGDRVKANSTYSWNDWCYGKIGVIICFEGTSIGVVFEGEVQGHDLDGECKWGEGWFLKESELEYISSVDPDVNLLESMW